jgi:hypothetical protein
MQHVRVWAQEGGFKDYKGRGGVRMMHMGQFCYNMGPELMGFSTRAIKATNSSKGLAFKIEL